MARQTVTQYFDDLDETALDESEVNIINFSFEGNNYVIDLSEENATTFREMMKPWMKAATLKKPKTKQRRQSADAATVAARRERLRKIREWAWAQGMEVASRGQIAAHVIAAYEQAHAGGDGSDTAAEVKPGAGTGVESEAGVESETGTGVEAGVEKTESETPAEQTEQMDETEETEQADGLSIFRAPVEA